MTGICCLICIYIQVPSKVLPLGCVGGVRASKVGLYVYFGARHGSVHRPNGILFAVLFTALLMRRQRTDGHLLPHVHVYIRTFYLCTFFCVELCF